MNLKPIYIEAVDIPDAWFQCVSSVIDNGNKYVVEHGSFIGQTRLEFDWITVYIKKPFQTTLDGSYDAMLPQIPEHLNIPNPVTEGYIEEYVPYLMTDTIKPDEQYTYGSRMIAAEEIAVYTADVNKKVYYSHYDQIRYWIEIFKKTPNTNQAVLQVADPLDFLLTDPPCLRHIDMRIKDNQLIFYPYFRSWDLWGGFPANLAGIAVMQKDMADRIGVQTGPIIASSKGLHLYGYVEELAKIRANKNDD